jgi:hypothetical protein
VIYGETKIYSINDASRSGVFSTYGAYLTGDIIWARDPIYGGTLGVEVGAIGKTQASALGLEVSYLRNSQGEHSTSFGPKIGIPMGFLNFYYAYHFAMSDWAESEVGRNKFMLTLNLDLQGLKVKLQRPPATKLTE